MNKARRKQLSQVLDKLYEAIEMLQGIRECEAEAYDNMPESLQDSERGNTMQEYIDSMDEAYMGIEDYITALEEIIE